MPQPRAARLFNVSNVRVSTVDKHTNEDEKPVRLCNYVDVYKNEVILNDFDFMAATCTSDEIARFRLLPGDVLLTKDSETADDIGIPAFVETSAPDLVCGYHVAIATPRPALVDPKFLFWCLNARRAFAWWETRASGVTRVGLRQEDIRHLPLGALPPMSHQRAIADFLDRETAQIDAMIEAQEYLLRVVEERLSALGERTVFDPEQRPEDSQDAGWMGRVPRHWRVSALSSLCSLIQTGPFGSQLNAEEYEDEGVAVLNPADYVAGHINLQDAKKVQPTTASRLQRHEMRRGDVVTARRGDLGRSAVIRNRSVGSLCGTGSLLVRPHTDLLNPDFLVHVLGARRTREALADISVGSTMDNLNSKILGRFRVPVPPLAEQEKIIRSVSDASDRTEQVRGSALDTMTLMRERREALITAAVTGRIDPTTGIERIGPTTEEEAS